MKEKIVWKIGKYRVRLDTVVFVLGIAGILLIGLSSLLPERGEPPQEVPVLETDTGAYAARLEERLQGILQQTEGVGKAQVMVTLEVRRVVETVRVALNISSSRISVSRLAGE